MKQKVDEYRERAAELQDKVEELSVSTSYVMILFSVLQGTTF